MFAMVNIVNKKQILFLIGNKTFIEKIEHHVHNGEHSEQETNTI